jgi:hypothetical protein
MDTYSSTLYWRKGTLHFKNNRGYQKPLEPRTSDKSIEQTDSQRLKHSKKTSEGQEISSNNKIRRRLKAQNLYTNAWNERMFCRRFIVRKHDTPYKNLT